MANPNSPTNGQGNQMDYVLAADGTARIKAASARHTSPSGATSQAAPTLVDNVNAFTGNGYKAVAVTHTAVAIAGSVACRRVMIKAAKANSAKVYIGISTVTDDLTAGTGGYQLEPGEAIPYPLDVDNLNTVFVNGTSGDGVGFLYWT